MSCRSDNSIWRGMAALCAAGVLLCCAAASWAAEGGALVPDKPARPVNPAQPNGPASADRPAPPRGPAPIDQQRMMDLARRMAITAPSSPSSPVAPVSPVSPSEATSPPAPASSAKSPGAFQAGAATDAQAAKANQQKLIDPDDQRPLGPRSTSGAAGAAALDSAPAGSSPLSIIGALGLVIIAIFAARGGLRRLLGGAVAAGQSSAVQVLTRIAVAPRNHVLLLRVGGRVLVVSDSAAGMRTLAQIDQPEEVADLLTTISSAKSTSAAGGFRQMLASFSGGYEGRSAADDGGDDGEFRIDRARDHVSGLLGKLRNVSRSRGSESGGGPAAGPGGNGGGT